MSAEGERRGPRLRRRPRAEGDGVSDVDREQAVDLLGAHTVSGLLSPDELSARSEAVLAARSRADLDAALQGLPALPRPPLLVRAAELVTLRTHVIVYAVVSAVLVVVWAVTRISASTTAHEGFRLLWPFWIMLLWGIPLVAQALYVLRQPLLRRARGRRR
ncbi:MAG: DUF1707 domain-containing protein [Thermoleophilia bacterium]|nr:DUF1707 domain-containing protein [Thermoleophilia bacterium]